jgi:hypothetical protein
LGILSDLRDDRKNSENLSKDRLEQFYSLGVGPLRTSLSGSIRIVTHANPLEAVRSHIESMNPQRYLRNSLCCLAQFAELADELTEQEQV